MQNLKIYNFLITLTLTTVIFSDSSLANDLEQQQAAELSHIKRRLQRQGYSTLLANALSGEGFPQLTTIQKDILQNFDLTLIEEIYHDALEDTFYEQPLNVISLKLWQVFEQNSKNSKAFESMVRSQLTLFSLYNMYQELDFKYLMQFVLILNQVTQESLYNSQYQLLPEKLKLRLQKAIQNLPSSLQNVFFESQFCLINQMTDGILNKTEQPIFPKGQELYVLTEALSKFQENSTSNTFEIDIFENNGNITDLVIIINSSPPQWKLIKAEYLPFLTASQQGYTNPIDNGWSIDLVSEEGLVFKSKVDSGFICLPDENSNVVNVMAQENVKENKLCQWKAVKCEKITM